jgi:hypothetical protein
VQEYERADEELNQMGRGQTSSAVELLNEMGIALAKSGQWLQAASVHERGLAIEHRVSGGAEVSPMTQVNYAKVLAELGREPAALPRFDAASAAAKRRGDANGIIKVGTPT